jgi:MFS family permease
MSYAQVETTSTVHQRRSSVSNIPPSVPAAVLELELPTDNEYYEEESKPQIVVATTYTYEQFPTIEGYDASKNSTYDGSHISINDKFQDEFPVTTSSQNLGPPSMKDYYRVMREYPMYRAYFFSHVCQNMGDWFVRIASILVVEELSSSGKTLSHLALSVLLPKAIFAQVGGILADRFDRRQCMILLDVLSGIAVMGYLVAIHYRSLIMIYMVSALRSTLSATYYPITTGIVPLLVPDVQDLQLAATLNSWAWGMTSVIGGLVAGSITASIGLSACYIIDCVTFMLSAALIYWGVSGNYRVTSTTTAESGRSERKNPCDQTYTAFSQVLSYLWSCGFGLLVFSKASASLVWGIGDIVGAEFSTVFEADGREDEKGSSWHMGLLFSVIGAGCMTGPALVNYITSAHRPYTLQRAILIGLCFLTGGWFSISAVRDSFPGFLVCTFFRTMGSGIVWVNSTVLLQAMSEKQVLGRVLAVEYALTALLEALAATISGDLADAGYSKNQLALFGALLGVGVVVPWSIYYALSLGAAHPRFNRLHIENNTIQGVKEQGESKSLELTGGSASS